MTVAALVACFFALAYALSDLGGAPAPGPVQDLLRHRNYTEGIPGSSVQFDMIAIPGGTFFMGSPDGEKGRGKDEGPQHLVKVRPFWMGKCEVTWNEFDLYRVRKVQFREENEPVVEDPADAVTSPTPPYIDHTYGYGEDGYPVIGVTHHSAMEYCRWLSIKTGKAYRLPTEAEWEHACRAGTRSAYSFGDDPAKLKEHAWLADNAEDKTHPVGSNKPNPWGLYDMHGNVAEWCLDHYREDYYATFPPGSLPLAPVNMPTANRYPHVVRGGSWADDAPQLRSASRRASNKLWNRQDPAVPQSIWWLTNADHVGFRIVRAVDEQKELRGLRSKVTPESR
jgi:formylglycine-generating enzyme required for sulfatase activity